MKRFLLFVGYTLAIVNLVVWTGVVGNISRVNASAVPSIANHSVNMTREAFPVKPQWI
jgi:hypothetical protein